MLFNLSKQALGDQRPSEVLSVMRSLSRLPPDAAGNSKKIDILLTLWLRRLSDPVRDAHTATTSPPIHAATPLPHLALLMRPSQLHHCHAIQHAPTGPLPGPRLKNIVFAHRTPPPPPLGGLTLLQNCVITILVLGILPRNVKNRVWSKNI